MLSLIANVSPERPLTRTSKDFNFMVATTEILSERITGDFGRLTIHFLQLGQNMYDFI